jgi:FKBP-type peptidyl-prolyl cis-trans isomerase SlyD
LTRPRKPGAEPQPQGAEGAPPRPAILGASFDGCQLGPGIFARIAYEVADAEGESISERTELGCVIGYGALLPAVEEALAGLVAGDKKSVRLPPALAYGERDARAILEVSREDFPDEVAAGDRFEAEREDGVPMLLQVLEADSERVVLDLNHPLAGQTVRVALEVLEARAASAEELRLAEASLAEDEDLAEEDGASGLLSPERLLRPRPRR